MNTESNDKAPDVMDARTIKINRIKLIAIFAVAVVPVIFAFTMYFGGVAIPSAKTNKGHLIWPPVAIDSLTNAQQLPEQVSLEETLKSAGKWTLMMTGGNQCDAACQSLIHTVRQVNVSMAKEMDRVNRVLVSSLGASDLAQIEQEYPHLVTHYAMEETLSEFVNAAAEQGAVSASRKSLPWQVWLVDPIGNVILQYTDQHTGYDMIGDLKRLLKLSNIG